MVHLIGMLPIRKVSPDRVALTSYYSKTFVSRSTKRVNNYALWIQNHITEMGLNSSTIAVTELHPAKVFDNHFKCPRLYSALAMAFTNFTLNFPNKKDPRFTDSYQLSFDHTQRKENFGEDVLKTFEVEGSVVIGKNNANSFMVMDKNNFLYSTKEGNLTELGTLEELLGIDTEKVKVPTDFAELKVMSKLVPVGIVLAYEIGLTNLLNQLKIKPREDFSTGRKARIDIATEFAIEFEDVTLIFDKSDQFALMLFGGFVDYQKSISQYSIHEFDKQGVYFNILESNGISVRYLREINLLFQMFVDPITKDLLVEMKEPTTFHGLLLRSCELLLSDDHPDEFDPAFMRIKGYERMAGAVYGEIVASVRAHNALSGKARQQIDFNPNSVWKTISQDRAVALVSDINPIQALKETEAVTYNGTGGRSAISMTRNARVYHRNDMGTISESTVDSSDVALNIYTSADPIFTSLRGMSNRYDSSKTGAASLLSTSALMSPCADMDD